MSALQSDYQSLQQDTQRDKEAVARNAQEVQARLQDANGKIKKLEWELGESQKGADKSQERIEELESEIDALGTLHEEMIQLNDTVVKSEKKIRALTAENEGLITRIEAHKGIALKVNELEEKVELADEVAMEIERLNTALKEEQIEHRRLAVELRKAQERETHLEELNAQNKELGWELMKARTLIGQYMAQDEERAILGSGVDEVQIGILKAELKEKEELLRKTIVEKEDFTSETAGKSCGTYGTI